ncbi:MAG: aminoglycoside phosphotransferase family protein [Oscillospiraceae bacterium]|nr:aminoglycoside phosphotransferase family protein [Oscillospiraceae bacterium]
MGPQPEKWRDTVDPFALPLEKFRLQDVLGYPHAGNDVFYTAGTCVQQSCPAFMKAFIKVERQSGADLRNEAAVLRALPYPYKPNLLEYVPGPPACLVTEDCEGDRLSVILNRSGRTEALEYMEPYGAALAQLHSLAFPWTGVKHRRFFDLPQPEYLEEHRLTAFADFLASHPPEGESRCFIHGDFHYANILWRDGRISAVLDYELSGRGVREFDLAWAVLLRPGQAFLKTQEELARFLEGYGKTQAFSWPAFRYYYILAALWFYGMGGEAYRRDLRQVLERLTVQ